MSAPISAMMHSAPRCWMPVIVHSSSTAGAKGRICSSIASGELLDLLVEEVDVARGSRRSTARDGRRSGPASASRSAGIFLRICRRASSASTSGSVVPATSASSMSRPDLPRMSAATQSSLMPASSSALCSRLTSRCALLDLRLAIARQVAQLADRLGRHEARLQQPGLGELAQPRRVGDVGLAARDLLDVPGVDQHAARTRPRGSPTAPSSTRRWPPSRPA